MFQKLRNKAESLTSSLSFSESAIVYLSKLSSICARSQNVVVFFNHTTFILIPKTLSASSLSPKDSSLSKESLPYPHHHRLHPHKFHVDWPWVGQPIEVLAEAVVVVSCLLIQSWWQQKTMNQGLVVLHCCFCNFLFILRCRSDGAVHVYYVNLIWIGSNFIASTLLQQPLIFLFSFIFLFL